MSFQETECLLTRLPQIKCIRLGSVRSSLLPFKMHWVGYVRSSLPTLIACRVNSNTLPEIFFVNIDCLPVQYRA